MIDLAEQTIQFPCANCGKSHQVKLADVIAGSTITCTCGTNNKLVDHESSMANGVHRVNASFQKLEDTIKKLNQG
jgi:hypothetical protein